MINAVNQKTDWPSAIICWHLSYAFTFPLSNLLLTQTPNVPTDTNDFDYEAALSACANGDKRALQRIYNQESHRLLGVALRIVRHRQIAEDVIQDAFINIWTKAGTFDATRGSGRSWIYSIVRHQALNEIRSSSRQVSVDEEGMEAIEEQAALELAAQMPDAFELQADIGKMQDCLTRLDAAKRNSILFAYVDGYSHSEIAERLQSPLGTVKAWIKRGMSALRECMA